MFTITWYDRKGGYWEKRTNDKDDAYKTIQSLFRRRIAATCRKDGVQEAWGSVWKSDDGWNWFFGYGED